MIKITIIILSCILFSTHVAATVDFECTPKECRNNFKAIKKFAKNGSPEGQEILGNFYSLGYGTNINKGLARKWFLKSIKNGRIGSHISLAHMYLKDKNIEKVIKHFSKAAELGVDDAAFALGVLYGQGKETELDYVKAEKWLLMAAKNEHKQAQDLLVKMHNAGLSSDNNKNTIENYSQSLNKEDSDNNSLVDVNIETAFQEGSSVEVTRAPKDSKDIEIERIEVFASIETYINYSIARIKRSGLFNSKGTGSRIKGKSCDKTSRCSMISSPGQITKLMNTNSLFKNIEIMAADYFVGGIK